MIFILMVVFSLPPKEHYVYETNDKGKVGTMDIAVEKDSLGYRTIYTWEDRRLEVVFDSTDMSTVYVKKDVGDRTELKIVKKDQENKLDVTFRNRRYTYGYKNHAPIYDRHAVEYALRGFDLTEGFKETIRFHVPEYMVINADVTVVGEEIVSGPLGDIKCWKVEMKPNVWFINWRFYFWIEINYPHRFLKYTDSSGNNSIILIEYEQD